MTEFAEIEHTVEEDDEGRERACVYATCDASGDEVGPIWGDSEASVKRALATLTEECSCGADYHAVDE
jgi:hypothetical protein